MSFSIAWRVESKFQILTRLKIDIESSYEIDIKYSSRVTTLILSTQASQKVGMKTWFNDQFKINISSTSLHVLTNRIENFKSILDFNSLIQLNYLSQIFWFNLNTEVKNSDLNQVLTSWELDSILMTQLNAISLILILLSLILISN